MREAGSVVSQVAKDDPPLDDGFLSVTAQTSSVRKRSNLLVGQGDTLAVLAVEGGAHAAVVRDLGVEKLDGAIVVGGVRGEGAIGPGREALVNAVQDAVVGQLEPRGAAATLVVGGDGRERGAVGALGEAQGGDDSAVGGDVEIRRRRLASEEEKRQRVARQRLVEHGGDARVNGGECYPPAPKGLVETQ